MLGAHLGAKQPADTSRPGDPQAGTDPGKTAERPREDGGAEELLQLQRQVAGLHQQLRRQEARWSAALRHLQTQVDALKRRDRGPRGRRGATELQRPGAGRTPAASLQVPKSALGTTSPPAAEGDIRPQRAGRRSPRAPPRGQGLPPGSAPAAQQVSVKIERIASGEIVTREDGDKTVSISLRVRGAAAAGSRPGAEGQPAPPGREKAATPPGRSLPTPSGRTPARPAACGALRTEDSPAAQDTDACPSPSEGPGGESPTQAQTEGRARRSAGTEPQDLPTEADSSRPTGPGTGKEGRGGGTRSPGGKVGQAARAGREKDSGEETTVLHFLNGDTQRILPDQRVVYYCAGARTTRTTHPSGLQVLRLPNKRTEKFYPDGSRETVFPDGTVRRRSAGREETLFPDGTSVRVERNGDRTVVLSNGQRDIHTAQFKRREYPDGTVRTVYSCGLQETKFASGRVGVRHGPGSAGLDREQAVRPAPRGPQEEPVGPSSCGFVETETNDKEYTRCPQ